MKKITFLLFIIFFQFIYSQETKEKIGLDTIYLSSYFPLETLEIENLSKIFKKNIYSINSSPTLKNILENQSDIYFKEYGRGMLAGISIRGTGTSHTLVLWNGIPINSKMNGQVDFNTIYLSGLNILKIKKGGESILYGGGAIGGIIETGKRISFKRTKKISNQLFIGSYKSIYNYTNFLLSDNKKYIEIGYTTNYSQNDYSYPGLNQKNENGKYFGNDFYSDFGYKINKFHNIIFHGHFNFLDRNLSSTLYSPSNSKLNTNNSQNVLSWNYNKNSISNILQLGNVYEKYEYYYNKDDSKASISQSNNFIIKNKSVLQSKNSEFILGNQFETTSAKGDYLGKHTQNTYSVFGNILQSFKHYYLSIGLRKEISNQYITPLLVRAKILFKNNKTRTGISFSNNFRAPTFNDLYWVPGGNPHLKPEKSYSSDFFIKKTYNNFKIKTTLFYIDSKDLIKWVPYNNNIWMPINIDHATSKGIEFEINYVLLNRKNKKISLSGNYTYQNVTDKSTENKVPYVPSQIGLLNLEYRTDKFSFLLHNRYTSKVYTTTSNTLYLEPFWITDIKINVKINKIIEGGIGINNIFDRYYETSPSRPQPGRNFLANIKIKIQKL